MSPRPPPAARREAEALTWLVSLAPNPRPADAEGEWTLVVFRPGYARHVRIRVPSYDPDSAKAAAARAVGRRSIRWAARGDRGFQARIRP